MLDFRSTTLPDSADLITWRIGDQGFDMQLSGKVPGRIATALRAELERTDAGGLLRGQATQQIDLWAVHAGGRTVLDGVEQGLRLPGAALDWSRGVLRDFGNMSSATIMFILDRMLRAADGAADRPRDGVRPGPMRRDVPVPPAYEPRRAQRRRRADGHRLHGRRRLRRAACADLARVNAVTLARRPTLAGWTARCAAGAAARRSRSTTWPTGTATCCAPSPAGAAAAAARCGCAGWT